MLGGAAPTQLAPSVGTWNEVASDGTDVFVTEYDGAGAIKKFSSTGVASGAYAAQSFVRGLTVDADNVYWSTIGSFVNYSGRGVWAAPKNMTGAVSPVIAEADFGGPKATLNYLAGAGGDLFAITFETTPTIKYHLLHHKTDGSGTTTELLQKSQLGGLAADATYLYYSDFDDTRPAGEKNQMWRVPRANLTAAPESIFKGVDAINETISRVAVDDQNLYLVTVRTIFKLPKN